MALADLGGRVSQYKVIADAAADHVNALVRVVRETVHVAVLDGTWVIDVVMAEPARSLRIDAHLGRRLDAYCTAFGKVLLAGLDGAGLDAYLGAVPLERKTATTITEADALRAEISEVRRKGFAIDDQETEDGLYAISVPILDPEGHVRAALAVSGPASRLGADRVASTVETLSRSAGEIAGRLFRADVGDSASNSTDEEELQSAL
jgi:IclR family pca regulon transcriptional regulator